MTWSTLVYTAGNLTMLSVAQSGPGITWTAHVLNVYSVFDFVMILLLKHCRYSNPCALTRMPMIPLMWNGTRGGSLMKYVKVGIKKHLVGCCN